MTNDTKVQPRDDHFRKFDEMDESTVRANVTHGRWADLDRSKHSYAIEWLRLKDESRLASFQATRSAEHLSAISIARRAMIAAYIAAAIATIGLIADIIFNIDKVKSLIGLPSLFS